MNPTPDQSVVWLSIAREAFAHSSTASDAALALERLGRQAGLGGAFALGLQELVAYASAASDRAQDAIDAELEAVAASRRIVCPLLEAKLQARLDALDAQLRGKCSCDECGKVMQSEGRPKRSWDSSVGQLSLKRRQTPSWTSGRTLRSRMPRPTWSKIIRPTSGWRTPRTWMLQPPTRKARDASRRVPGLRSPGGVDPADTHKMKAPSRSLDD